MPVEYLPLTVSQKWLLRESFNFKQPGWVTIEFLAKTKLPMEEWAMQEAIYYLVDKYESLRVKFVYRLNQWMQEVYPLSDADPFACYSAATQMKEICTAARNELLPEKGNLIKIIYFKCNDTEGRIWFCMHHLISDYVSAVTLAKEFMLTYNAILDNKEIQWHSGKEYRKWLYLVDGYCRDVLLPAEQPYWNTLPWHQINILPTDYPERFPDEASVLDAVSNNTLIDTYKATVHIFDSSDTMQLYNRYGAGFEEVLHAVFFLAIANSKQVHWLNFDVGNAGRDLLPAAYGVDVYKVPGYFSFARALFLQHPQSGDALTDFQQVLKQIKNIPNGGKSFYHIRQYLNNTALSFHATQQSIIFLNYLGRVDALAANDQFELVPEDTGLGGFVTEFRKNLLLCMIGIRENQLCIQLDYSELYFKKATIEQIVDEMKMLFREILSEQVIEKMV